MKAIKPVESLLFVFLLLTACTESSSQEVKRVDNSEFSEIIEADDVQLLDVRTPEEVAKGIISDAAIIDFYDPAFETKVQSLDKDKPVAVYCAAGGRSAQASKKLADLGFKKIYDLKSGYRGWVKEGLPTNIPE